MQRLLIIIIKLIRITARWKCMGSLFNMKNQQLFKCNLNITMDIPSGKYAEYGICSLCTNACKKII